MAEAPSEVEQAQGVYVNLLRPAIVDLALNGEDQIAWMRRTGFPSDELSLQFDDAYQSLWLSRGQGWLADEVVVLLERIDGLLSEMSGPQYERWSDDAVLGSADWEQLREWARRCLDLMPERPPLRDQTTDPG